MKVITPRMSLYLSTKPNNGGLRWLLIFLTMAAGTLLLASCSGETTEKPDEEQLYSQAVSDFYMSLGASQTDQSRFAFNKMNEVAQAFPKETSAWANLAVFAMRQGNFELSNERINQAIELSPDHPQVLHLAGIIKSRQGNISSAVEFFRGAVEADPDNLLARYSLAQELEREDDAANAREIESAYEEILSRAPDNQAVLLELARLAVKNGDIEEAGSYLDRLYELNPNWDNQTEEQFSLVFDLIENDNSSELPLEISFLRSGLEAQASFQEDLQEVRLPPTEVGFLITDFIILPQPTVRAAEPDMEMSLSDTTLDLPQQSAAWVKGVTLLEDSPPFPIAVSDGEIIIDETTRFDFPGSTERRLHLHAVTEIDYNYDFRNDLAAAGDDGFRLYRLNDDRTFSDVTSEMNLPGRWINRNYRAVWPFDIEMDGDLDLFLSPVGDAPVVFRNNGDGTFTAATPFDSENDIIRFLWGDLTGDGTPEAITLSLSGTLAVYENLRGGEFDDGSELASNIRAIEVADRNADTQFEIIATDEEGSLVQFRYSLADRAYNQSEILPAGSTIQASEDQRLFAADLDNNGALDLILSSTDGTDIWLGGTDRTLQKYSETLAGKIYSVFDVEGDERLDLLGISGEMAPFELNNRGTKGYSARSIRARASGTTGDQRINSFGIGGEMEVRSGLLYQKQLITSPIVHFGLGEYAEADMLRIIWPNGSVQAEFAELGMGDTIFNEQILKGSCPWLFTNDGEQINFVTDILWRSPLGLRINAQETAGVVQTLDRVKIPGSFLSAVEGVYDLRVTAELWETHFFDYVSLVAVDHPEDTEIFIDERFVFPAPDLSTVLTTGPVPPQSVTDQFGNDLTSQVSDLDQVYIKPFQRTQYQGLVEEHSIVISLNDSEKKAAEKLIMHGWLKPTDSSINLALSQGSIAAPRGLRVETSDSNGNWKLLHENYGFPAGKLKTILLDLEGAFEHKENRRVRLTTTSEIYWDYIAQAGELDEGLMTETRLQPLKMDLRYRGYSEWIKADSLSPLLPDYSEISGTTQRWRDLEGYHTRFGDVSELMQQIDDRYVIMNAGDEMVLHFEDPGPPKDGFKRSFVFVSDGWVKDGDYNTEASATVHPLPYHGQADYEYQRRGELWDDPVFKRHSRDWIDYHTRYITPESFRTALNFER